MIRFFKKKKPEPGDVEFELFALISRCERIEKTMLTMAAWIVQSSNAPLNTKELERLEEMLWGDLPGPQTYVRKP